MAFKNISDVFDVFSLLLNLSYVSFSSLSWSNFNVRHILKWDFLPNLCNTFDFIFESFKSKGINILTTVHFLQSMSGLLLIHNKVIVLCAI